MLKLFCVALAATSALTLAVQDAPAEAQPQPGPWVNPWPPGPTRDYLRNLQRPDNWKSPSRWPNPTSLLCCDESDEIKTKFKVGPGDGPHPEDQWHAWINGEWVLVPPDKIVPDHAPDGQAYLFVIGGMIQCFVRPRGGL